jgi:hypothetical protein
MSGRTHIGGQIQTPSGTQDTRIVVHDINVPIQSKAKHADETVTSSTTVQDDDHLTGFWLPAGRRFALEAGLSLIQNVGDFRFKFNFTSAPVGSSDFIIWTATDVGGNHAGDMGQNVDGTHAVTTMADAARYGLEITAGFQANATADSVMNFTWAQDTSSANATTVYAGSWIKLTKIDIT